MFAISIFVSHANAAREFQVDRIELGLSAGVGFYMGQNQVNGFTRIQGYDCVGAILQEKELKNGWPGIETFGFSVGYRFNTMFQAKLQTTRQRIVFMEYEEPNDKGHLYYNAMWHTDAMLEYNILPYGVVGAGSSGVYNIVPYVGLGIGVTVYNKEASLRNVDGRKDIPGSKLFSLYPRVGYKQVWKPKLDADGKEAHVLDWTEVEEGVGVALYVPIAMGAKWRIDEHWQLKATFQYQLYFQNNTVGGLNSNLEGATYNQNSKWWIGEQSYDISTEGRPTFDDLEKTKRIVGQNHDFLFSLTAIFNFSTWYEERIVEY